MKNTKTKNITSFKSFLSANGYEFIREEKGRPVVRRKRVKKAKLKKEAENLAESYIDSDETNDALEVSSVYHQNMKSFINKKKRLKPEGIKKTYRRIKIVKGWLE